MKNKLFYIIIPVLLTSCNSLKKMQRQADNYIKENPEQAAIQFRNAFPCIEKKRDTVTVIRSAKPDTFRTIKTVLLKDTVLITETLQIEKPVTVTQTITVKVEDSSKIAEQQARHNRERELMIAAAERQAQEIMKGEQKILELKGDCAKFQDKINRQRKNIYIVSLLLILSIGWNFRKLIFKLF